jgi:hypothetical protein
MFKKTTYYTLRSGRRIVAGQTNRPEIIGWFWLLAFGASLVYLAFELTA